MRTIAARKSGRLRGDRGIVPERRPAAEDVKKIERRLPAAQKKLPQPIEGFEGPTTEARPEFLLPRLTDYGSSPRGVPSEGVPTTQVPEPREGSLCVWSFSNE
jgi:hypothetical protein